MTMTTAIPAKPPVPPFTDESATLKVRLAENAWNSRDPQVVAQAYSIDSVWRNRSVFVTGREQIIDFLSGKWEREHEYRLIKELWATARAALRSALPTNTTTMRVNGFAPTAMRTGYTTNTV